MNKRLRLAVVLSVTAILALSCAQEETNSVAFTGDSSRGNPIPEQGEEREVTGEPPEATPMSGDDLAQLNGVLESNPAECEFLDPRSCLLPFPSDFYTVPDTNSGTGLRVAMPAQAIANFDPTEWNRNDGFSPSTPILLQAPAGLDLSQTTLPTEGDISVSTTDESATVLLNLDSGQLIPHWTEVDSHATSDEDRTLIIRPATSLTHTRRIAVAVRDLNNGAGDALTPPAGFRAYRDNLTTDIPTVENRRADFERLFSALADVGVNRPDTYMVWSFTVASADSIAGRLLHMREDGLGQLNGGSPEFTVSQVTTSSNDQITLREGIAHVVEGTFEVPSYLADGGAPGARMTFEHDLPVSNGTMTAEFTCSVPEAAVTGETGISVVYGHGLLGSRNEARSSQVQETAVQVNGIYCATNTIGMSNDDVGMAATALSNINEFPAMADRMQQGMLNTLFLGRLLVHDEGFATHSAFQNEAGEPAFDTTTTYYDGNSQGAIMGGAITAVAVDWTKAVLGVGGMNYSTLLNRSKDFDQYAVVLRQAYPNPLDQQIIFGLLQMLWDRGETSGYVQHMTTRAYDRTPAKSVLMHVAFGDHQVATITAENIARALNIPVYRPIMSDERLAEIAEAGWTNPFFNLRNTGQFPIADGSALVYWDSGTLAPELGNITPIASDTYNEQCVAQGDEDSRKCADPHEDPRRQEQVFAQKKAFFQSEGVIINPCGDEPCVAQQRSEFDY